MCSLSPEWHKVSKLMRWPSISAASKAGRPAHFCCGDPGDSRPLPFPWEFSYFGSYCYPSLAPSLYLSNLSWSPEETHFIIISMKFVNGLSQEKAINLGLWVSVSGNDLLNTYLPKTRTKNLPTWLSQWGKHRFCYNVTWMRSLEFSLLISQLLEGNSVPFKCVRG